MAKRKPDQAERRANQSDAMRDEWDESPGQGRASSRGEQGGRTSVAKITEISATSTKSFEDAIRVGLARATKTLRNVRSAWIKEQQVRFRNDQVSDYQVNMLITFVIDD
jgi:flavin-binding protein dodecin